MSFIRPEVAELLVRWREVLIGLGIMLIGAWFVAQGGWLMIALGCAVALGGLALAWTGSRRTLFRASGEAAGVVQIVEGRIGYFGPFYGGTVSLDDITRIEMHAARGGSAYWHLHRLGEAALVIPAAAKGADTLFDAFLTLPGLTSSKLLEAQRDASVVTRIVWQRPGKGVERRVLT